MTTNFKPVGKVHYYGPASDLNMFNSITQHPEDTHVLWNTTEPIYAHPHVEYDQIQLNMDNWMKFELPPDHPLHRNFYHVSCCHKRTSGGDFNGPQFGVKVPWTDVYGFNMMNQILENFHRYRYTWDWHSKPEYLLSYTIGRPKIHRVKVLLHLIDLGLMPESIVNFCNSSDLWNQFLTDYKLSPRIIEKILPFAPQILHAELGSRRVNGYYFHDKLIPGYDLTLCEVVSETCHTYVVLSEKTFRPLLLGKPFIVLGSAKQNEIMKSLGFVEYDELFNYNYQMENDNDFTKYRDSLIPLCDIDTSPKALMDLKIKLRPKVEYNQSVVIKRLFDDSLIPDAWMIPPLTNVDQWVSECRDKIKNHEYFGQFV